MMRQPRGGLPGVDDGLVFLVRVPIYGLTDSRRAFWLRPDSDAKQSGIESYWPNLFRGLLAQPVAGLPVLHFFGVTGGPLTMKASPFFLLFILPSW